MIDSDFLKTLNVLYVEQDDEQRGTFEQVFKKVFKQAFTSVTAQEAISKYKKTIDDKANHIDIVISDMKLADMTGIELLQNIRAKDNDIPFIITSSESNSEHLLNAIENSVSYFAIKPLDIGKLINHIGSACHILYEHKLAQHNHHEAQEYINIIDRVAIISKTDLKGNITFVNDIFCEVAGYEREELIGQPHNIVRHNDMPSGTFQELWETIQKGVEWSGKVKNCSKDGEAYSVNATVYPLYDELDNNVIGYMGIRFLTTDDENEKREFKVQVRDLVKKSNSDLVILKNENKILKQQLSNSADTRLMEEQLLLERKKIAALAKQIKYYENVIKELHGKMASQVKTANEKLAKFYKAIKALQHKIEELESTIKVNESDHQSVQDELQSKIEEVIKQNKIISDLKEVIEHREDQLGIN